MADVGSTTDVLTSPTAAKMFRPFARPRKRRRRSGPSKPTQISVRKNPENYSLNFTDGDGAERSLLSHVLSGKRIVCLVGLPGSGKSVIMRGLAYHPTISSTFRDGIYLIQLDKKPDVPTLLRYLHEVASSLCGIHPPKPKDSKDKAPPIPMIPPMVTPDVVSALGENWGSHNRWEYGLIRARARSNLGYHA